MAGRGGRSVLHAIDGGVKEEGWRSALNAAHYTSYRRELWRYRHSVSEITRAAGSLGRWSDYSEAMK